MIKIPTNPDTTTKMKMEEEVKKTVSKITENSTFLLILAVVLFSISNSFGVMLDPTSDNPSVYILGTATLANRNIIYIEGIGAIFGLINALLMVLVNLCAGLSFAAVCFDENRNIWFRVVAVAALMLILYGGLNIF